MALELSMQLKSAKFLRELTVTQCQNYLAKNHRESSSWSCRICQIRSNPGILFIVRGVQKPIAYRLVVPCTRGLHRLSTMMSGLLMYVDENSRNSGYHPLRLIHTEVGERDIPLTQRHKGGLTMCFLNTKQFE